MSRALVLLMLLGSLLALVGSPRAKAHPALPPSNSAAGSEGELRRRVLFGAQLAPMTNAIRDRHKLPGTDGVVLEKIYPGTSAADSEFQAGDIVVAVGESKITGVASFLEKLERLRGGDVLAVELVRDGVRSKKQVTFKEMPREEGDGYDVSYAFVTSRGARLRTIVTRPRSNGHHPAVLLLQGGHTCFSIESVVGSPGGFTWLARSLARHGYVTMRVERPGCGDSEGGPLRDVDFDTEIDGFKQALRALKNLECVDAKNVFLFGHSMGGIVAPLIAAEEPVRGIAVYGTASGTWFESVFEQRRRLASLDGTDPAEVDREILGQARLWYPLLVEKKTPREIRERDPNLPGKVYDQWVKDDLYVADRHFRFHHQVASKNLAEAWMKVAATRLPVPGDPAGDSQESQAPRVLAMWGATDWMSTRSQQTWIVDIVNRVKPGSATFVALDGIDHFFIRTASPEESFRYLQPVKGQPAPEYNTLILETLRAWLDQVAARTKRKSDEAKGPQD